MKNFHAATIIRRQEFKPELQFTEAEPVWFKNSIGVSVLRSELNKTGANAVHQYHFDPTKFTVEQAKKWMKKNEISFAEFVEAEEPAIEEIPLELKLGSRHNKADMETLQKLHGMAHEMIQHLEALGAHPGHQPYQEVKSAEDGVPEEWS